MEGKFGRGVWSIGSMADLSVVVTCPACKQTTPDTMPTDCCIFFWDCPQCKAIIRPKAGDCCVYCSYGDKRCPPIQDNGRCCSN